MAMYYIWATLNDSNDEQQKLYEDTDVQYNSPLRLQRLHGGLGLLNSQTYVGACLRRTPLMAAEKTMGSLVEPADSDTLSMQ